MDKTNFIGSEFLTNEQLNTMQDNIEKETDRNSGFNNGSYVLYNNVNNFIVSGNFYDITNGSTISFTFFRDGNGFITSGTSSELGKTINYTFYRDANSVVISGLIQVT